MLPTVNRGCRSQAPPQQPHPTQTIFVHVQIEPQGQHLEEQAHVHSIDGKAVQEQVGRKEQQQALHQWPLMSPMTGQGIECQDAGITHQQRQRPQRRQAKAKEPPPRAPQ